MNIDRSNRLLVMLQRDDRSKYRDFYCPYCQAFITQLNNEYVASMSDTPQPGDPAIGHPTTCPTRRCRVKIYFVLSE